MEKQNKDNKNHDSDRDSRSEINRANKEENAPTQIQGPDRPTLKPKENEKSKTLPTPSI